MEMLVEEHPEMRAVVGEYKRMTLIEKIRKRAEARERDRRDTWAALEYAKDEGRDEGREEVRAELGKVIEEKDRELEELRRKLQAAGIDVP
jgi:flagellar biosynthesis/type III secretory pathway protein FliH